MKQRKKKSQDNLSFVPYKNNFPILQQYVYCNLISYNYILLIGASKTSLTAIFHISEEMSAYLELRTNTFM
jgi:hypothetical protein